MNKSIWTLAIVIILAIMVIIILFLPSNQQKTVPTTTLINTTANITASTQPNLVLSAFRAYSQNMSVAKSLTINYDLIAYAPFNITQYTGAFSRNVTLYRYNNESLLTIYLAVPGGTYYYYLNNSLSIFCNLTPLHTSSCIYNASYLGNSALPLYIYLSRIYSIFNGNGFSYNGTKNIAGMNCNLYVSNASSTELCINPATGYPLYISTALPGIILEAKSISTTVNTSMLGKEYIEPSYGYSLRFVSCNANKLAVNVTPFFNISSINLPISAYSLGKPSNIPAAMGILALSDLTAGKSVVEYAYLTRPLNGTYLVEIGIAAHPQTIIARCS